MIIQYMTIKVKEAGGRGGLLMKWSEVIISDQNILEFIFSPLRNLITSATDYLSSLTNFSNCDETTVYSIIVNYEATNITYGAENFGSGTYIDSETA